MNEQDYNQLRELSWRRPLTPAEAEALEKYLQAQPEAAADWADETALNQMLERPPAAPPVASNFTARVLQAVALENAAAERARAQGVPVWRNFLRWAPRAVVAGIVAAVAFGGYYEQQISARAALAKNVVEFTAAVSASDPQVVQDLEPIRRLSDPQPKADIELIALMK